MSFLSFLSNLFLSPEKDHSLSEYLNMVDFYYKSNSSEVFANFSLDGYYKIAEHLIAGAGNSINISCIEYSQMFEQPLYNLLMYNSYRSVTTNIISKPNNEKFKYLAEKFPCVKYIERDNIPYNCIISDYRMYWLEDPEWNINRKTLNDSFKAEVCFNGRIKACSLLKSLNID